MQDLSGRKLGQFELRERLGRGGMAEVYKSYQAGIDRFVAVKVMLGSLNEDESFIERFRREARAIGNLRHAHIVQAIDFGIEEGLYYLAMEFVEGGDLKAFIQKHGKVPPRAALRIAGQLADALAYAHDRGMVHRDLKPANVMFLDAEGRHAILTDFGIARIMGESGLTGTGMAVGTPDYMSPEAGKGIETDHRTDIYALGIILYEMLVGEVPYSAETPLAVIMKHINAPIPSIEEHLDDIPEFVETIIERSLAKDPEDRYQSAHDMKLALDEALAEIDKPRPASAALQAAQSQQESTALSAARKTAIPSDKVTEIVSETSALPQSNNTMLMGVGAVVGIAIIAVIAFFAMSNNDASATPTTDALIISDATEAVPTIVATDAPTDIPEVPIDEEIVEIPYDAEMPPHPENLLLTSGIAPIVDEVERLQVDAGQEAALAAANEFLEANPDDFYGLFARALAYSFEWDEEGLALVDANQLLELEPDNPFTHIALGHAYFFSNSDNADEVAGDAIQHAYELDPDNVHAAWRWAGFTDSDNQLELLLDAEAAGARGWQYITLAADILYDYQEYERAISYLYVQATEELNGEYEYWQARYKLMGALIQTGQEADAYELAQEYSDEVEDAEGFMNIAYVAYRAHEWEQAKQWANTALALNGDFNAPRYLLALIAWWGDGDVDAALEQLNALEGVDTWSLFTVFEYEHDLNLDRARIMTDAGRAEEGLAYYNAALEDWNYTDWLYEERADSYLELGDVEAARADLQTARDITGDDEYWQALLQRIIELGPAPTSEPGD